MLQKFIKWLLLGILGDGVLSAINNYLDNQDLSISKTVYSMLNYFFGIPWYYSITINSLGLIICVAIEKILFAKSKIILPELFTNSDKTASIVNLAQSISKYYKIEPSRMHFLLLQGFWNGSFQKFSKFNRLLLLRTVPHYRPVKEH